MECSRRIWKKPTFAQQRGSRKPPRTAQNYFGMGQESHWLRPDTTCWDNIINYS